MNLAERLGYAPGERVLILNADDVGSSHASNLATFECLERGSLTSASLLVPAPWFPEAAAHARSHPDVDFGIHLTLTCEYTGYRWRALADRATSPGLYDDEGCLWHTMNEAIEHVSVEEAERELRAQIDTALAAGIDVTHIDTHMSTVIMPKFVDLYVSLALEYGTPLVVYRPNPERLRQARVGPLLGRPGPAAPPPGRSRLPRSRSHSDGNHRPAAGVERSLRPGSLRQRPAGPQPLPHPSNDGL